MSQLVSARLAALRQRIAAVAGSAPRGDEIEIVGVTKTRSRTTVDDAFAAGLRAVGENYAQEVVAKFAERPAAGEVHFIGQLQRNKVRHLVGLVDLFSSVDRLSLIDELAKRVPGARLLLQVDATGEPGKGGCPVDQVEVLAEVARDRGLHVEGLMTVGPTDGEPRRTAEAFATVRRRCDALGLRTCSMGMSDDFELAVAEGSTQIRIGTALFGPRPATPAAAAVPTVPRGGD